MDKFTVNDKFHYDIEVNGAATSVNGNPVAMDSSKTGKNSEHIIYRNKTFSAELTEINRTEKTCIIRVNGNKYTVVLRDKYDQLLKQLGLDNLYATKVAEIKAPMPGLVLNVVVKEGDEIKKGDNLLILEAMKMENMLKAPADGIIKKIVIKQGDKVEKNQILIQFG